MTAVGTILPVPAVLPDPPVTGAWCPFTRGFWTGGTYVTADELTAGDVFRYGTYTDHRVCRVESEPAAGVYPARVFVTVLTPDTGVSRQLILTPGEVVERQSTHHA